MAYRTCVEDGCEGDTEARGLCKSCYCKHWRQGTLGQFPTKPVPEQARCSEDGCDRHHSARGLCRMHYSRIHRGRWKKEYHSSGSTTPRSCQQCGELFDAYLRHVRAGKSKFCSSGCYWDSARLSEDELRERRRASKRVRRARERGARSEPYTFEEIAVRDGWKCGICAKRVGRSYPPNHPRSATLDHIIPLAAGGDDLRVNVQLAHRSCNSRKAHTGPGQLLLVG